MFLSAQRNLSALHLPVRLFRASSTVPPRRLPPAAKRRQQKG
jgi:hypothetical protein